VLYSINSGMFDMKWVKLKKYSELSGDTTAAVHSKRQNGVWLDNVHCKIAPDGNLWVNLQEVEKWVEGKQKNYSPQRRQA